jgi:phosphohistidine swiveling domain-containing protein
MTTFGMSIKRSLNLIRDVLGPMPEGMSIPIYPFSRLELLKIMAPRLIGYLGKLLKTWKNINQFLRSTPDWCQKMTARINEVKTKEELLSLWQDEIYPYNSKAWFTLLAGGSKTVLVMNLNKELIRLVGIEDANVLLSNLRGNSGIASLEPILGISKIIQGEIRREEYLMQYGHRGPHEFELSIPHPAEDTDWLERQIEEFKKSNSNVEELLNKQHARYEYVWERFQQQFPNKVNKIKKQIAKASEAARLREIARSEFVRVFRVNRAFALRSGELTGIGNDVFFLYLAEVLNLLSGDNAAVKHIPARKKTYKKYKALPPLPSIIRGRFDPFKWAEDPNRRIDYFDPTTPFETPDSETLKGFAGAAGRIEGSVRVLSSPEEGEMLQPGEILVASTTNIGWTPLFPRTAAIVTDIGAPLSHAAIVARELGIPAVVGCGNATSRLKTGDRVIVDGGQGVVQILNRKIY